MPHKEGSLEAPTRHPLDWRSEAFYDRQAIESELERVFDVCAGCRRCVSLCGAFPTLFDLVDETNTGEAHEVDKASYSRVVDQCYLCDLCYMTKCPYVPPHAWNIDFPHLMLRAKAARYKEGRVPLRDKVLSNTDALGHFAGIPIVTRSVNAINRSKPARGALESALGVDRKAWLPEFAPRKFRGAAKASPDAPVRDGERTPGKVAIYATCYVNFNEPGIGHDLLALLAHNDIPYVLVASEACCGMPLLEQGNLEGVAAKKEKNLPVLARYAREGYALMAAIPSCVLMYKQELPLMFPEEALVREVGEAFWDPFEYLVARHRDGLLKTDFKQPLGKISYHVPCHGRVQNLGRKTYDVLALVPGTEVKVVERCSGHAGTFGVKKEFHAAAMRIGTPVFKAMAESEPAFIASDCQLAGHHIAQGIEEAGLTGAPLAHPLTLLRKAYDI
ncbi:heterodisulfide reductase-related iron-sulfur binding cluster [Trinickia caryophylli]|uniref:Fe-S oxidoreductase n=1 Tax=Trinickia caryophylli TaxID=28094 RepID=A0A1X7FPH0_TRICW|nr:heterodisulfide reductase-related iron-sulfur binding cluster [Trinickia caryophylli]PMS13896.1 Fe-S oxidoreductase [Trinickia caryophylli]TRX14392.1 Fe-S oxidoreductase [Trinickia caryophylli]WQE14230.1 heterodisulfide reductase-related iron-sulfur binding cluster [Trinickia caryophylli]SMF55852.1 Fe-S oxidoreductase [Trinickia caryophylli]GLU33262.1 ferredoxin [Trinickia caryophylli]